MLRSRTVKSLLHWFGPVALTLLLVSIAPAPGAGEELNPLTLTKYMDPLPIPGVMPQAAPNYYEIGAWEIHQQLHSQLPPTYLFGYGPTQETASYPAATIEAQRGVPIDVHWTNHLGFNHPVSFAFDPTLEHAVTTKGIPIATHLHGAEVEPQSDGGPLTWFTAGFAEKGADWAKEVYHYVNTQLPTTLWYHDHAFGFTRHNVYAGLAGFYLLRDPGNEPAGLPSGPYEIPLVIQDKMFTTDGQLWYPNIGDNPEHPVWIPEFFGDVILVNGKIWPYLNVEPRKYRFRFLNGSNARFYSLALADLATGTSGPAFYQIGSDGGYLAEPVILNDPSSSMSPKLVIGPAERADIIIDFSAYAPGTELLLKNTAKAPFPGGGAIDPQTVGQIMLFRVVPSTSPDMSVIPPVLATVERLSNPTYTRTLTLNEVEGTFGPLGALLNGQTYMRTVTNTTEMPTLGTTEVWEVVNMTEDAHPIHLHGTQFQLLNRQRFNTTRYDMAFDAANGHDIPTDIYTPVDVTPYLKGKSIPADANERGWKDTFRMLPGQVTRLLVRYAPQSGSPAFAYDATAAPGYVWHCHILEHEENDMMHKLAVVAPMPPMTAGLGTREAAAPIATLSSPAPNPTTDASELRFSLTAPGHVELNLYDVSGRLMSRVANGWYEAGEHFVPWRRSGTSGETLAKGVYFVQLKTEGIVRSQKIVLSH